MILDLFLLTCIVVFIIDLSGFPDTIKRALGIWLGRKVVTLKPFDCSLCSSWWAGLIYLLIVGEFNLTGIALVALFSFLASPIQNLCRLLVDLINYLLTLIYKIIGL